jgi:hypothetical protein
MPKKLHHLLFLQELKKSSEKWRRGPVGERRIGGNSVEQWIEPDEIRRTAEEMGIGAGF